VSPPRSLGFRTDLMLLQLEGSSVERRDGYRVIRTPENPTFWWGNYVLLDEAPAAGTFDEALARFHAEHPTAAHVAIGVDGTDGVLPEEEAIRAAGFGVDRLTVMTATSVHAPPRPNRDATYRRLVSDADWEQALDLQMANNTEFEPVSHRAFTSIRLAAARRLAESGAGGWFGAFVDGTMRSGMGLFTDGSGVARFQAVDTHPDFRGRGLAGSLVEHVSRVGLDEFGAETLVMCADPDYLAIRVYRSVGFVDGETQLMIERKPPSA
jgi:GNAT superfamily N-acetyltransferase